MKKNEIKTQFVITGTAQALTAIRRLENAIVELDDAVKEVNAIEIVINEE
jgi:hypothetical protein